MNGPRHGRAAFVVLLPTLQCNLRCAYCFQQRAAGRWSADQAIAVLRKITSWAVEQRIERLHVHWQGGEALLLGTEFWRRVLPEAQAVARAHGLGLTQAMQTNLTRYESGLRDVVHEFFGGTLGSSFEPNGGRRYAGRDGTTRFHDAWRRAYARCTADGIRVGVLSLVNPQMLADGAAATLALLRDGFGLRRIRFTLPFAQPGEPSQGYWLDSERVGRFLVDAYDCWRAAGRDAWLHIKPFANLEARLLGRTPEEPGYCESTPDCTRLSMAVLPSGAVTLCDNFAHPRAAPPYGNLFEEPLATIMGGEPRRRMAQQVRALTDGRCRRCRFLRVCFGGCLAKSHLDPVTANRRFHYCTAYRLLFAAIERGATFGAIATAKGGDRTDT